jgi:hypothetical protein
VSGRPGGGRTDPNQAQAQRDTLNFARRMRSQEGGSTEASRYSALLREGDYWIGIPTAIDAHGAAFIRALHACHASP